MTPYPGTEFFEQVKDQIADFDYYEVQRLHAGDEVPAPDARAKCRNCTSAFVCQLLLSFALAVGERTAGLARACNRLASAGSQKLPGPQ